MYIYSRETQDDNFTGTDMGCISRRFPQNNQRDTKI